MGVKVWVFDNEPVQEALRRLRNLLWECRGYDPPDLRRQRCYSVKPSAVRRWKRFQARRNRKYYNDLGQLYAGTGCRYPIDEYYFECCQRWLPSEALRRRQASGR
jgi:hypothetical protein